MKRLFVTAVLVGMVVLAGCGAVAAGNTGVGGGNAGGTGGNAGGGGAAANEVDMASVNFVQRAITIPAASTVKFVDPTATGAFHDLCFGHDQVCTPNPNGPAALNASGGVPVNAGDLPLVYTFAHPGTYEVTCTVHVMMNVVITVH